MADNKRKKKADGKRVALKQDYERRYLLVMLQRVRELLDSVDAQALYAREILDAATIRLRAGFPARRANREARKR